MSKLVLALLDDKDQLQKFHEINMEWVEKFNESFEKSDVPFKADVYKEELVDMTSYAVLNELVTTENDEQFRVDRTPLHNILHKLFGHVKEEDQQPPDQVRPPSV